MPAASDQAQRGGGKTDKPAMSNSQSSSWAWASSENVVVVVMVVDKVLVMFTITLDVNGFPLDLLRFKNIISKKNIDILIL